jgi:hypothetical protein
METVNEIDKLFLEKIKPFEERINELEAAEREKDGEIERLKQSIQRLSKVLDEFKQHKILATR